MQNVDSIMTNYHARYYAYMLSHPELSGIKQYLPALAGACIDLHPHQLDASVFAGHAPFGGGAILADEEGLGKTIEASIYLSQRYFAGSRRLLVCVPLEYTDHWTEQLEEKFMLPVIHISQYPDVDGIVLATYSEVAESEERFAEIPWDAVVIDEAHRLANASAMKTGHKTSDAIYRAFRGRYKLMLTATPMQRLLDLFYLIRFTDDTVFGTDPEAFRKQYIDNTRLRDELAERAQQICYRTLRRNALTLPQTERVVSTVIYEPNAQEIALSKNLSLYLHREDLQAFPKIQSHYIRLTLYKLLSSSHYALLNTLRKVMRRLEALPDTEDERDALQAVMDIASSLGEPTKFGAFLKVLKDGMAKMRKTGAPRKAVVFMENIVTLHSLKDFLEGKGFSPVVYGTRDAEARFKDDANIMLCMPKASERPDFSYAALVINYDLPWNALKMEQRIARCQRYGQKHDVLVINLIDPTNRADRRIWTVINKKLRLFDDTFGASGTLLGQVISDKEEGIIGDGLRTKKEIAEDQALFEAEHEDEIQADTARAHAELLSHFDERTIQRFKLYQDIMQAELPQMDDWLWAITKFKLGRWAQINDENRSMILQKSPYKDVRLSGIIFHMDKQAPRAQRYRLGHPLARRMIEDCTRPVLYSGEIIVRAGNGFLPEDSGLIGMWEISALCSRFYNIYPVLVGITKDGKSLDSEKCAALMRLPVISCHEGEKLVDEDTGETHIREYVKPEDKQRLDRLFGLLEQTKREEILLRTDEQLESEMRKIRRVAEDEAIALQMLADRQRERITALRREAEQSATLAARFAINKKIADAEKQAREAEQQKFLGMGDIASQMQERMEAVRERAQIRFSSRELFALQYKVIDK